MEKRKKCGTYPRHWFFCALMNSQKFTSSEKRIVWVTDHSDDLRSGCCIEWVNEILCSTLHALRCCQVSVVYRGVFRFALEKTVQLWRVSVRREPFRIFRSDVQFFLNFDRKVSVLYISNFPPQQRSISSK